MSVLMAVWITSILLSMALTALYVLHTPRNAKVSAGHRVLLVVPVKATADQGLAAFLDSLETLAYDNWHVVFVVATAQDASHRVIAEFLAAGRVTGQLKIAGHASQQGQKIQNLLAGVECIANDDEFLVFTDADNVLPSNFIGRLVFPLAKGRCEISTSYRMIVPSDAHIGSLLAASINLQVACFPRYSRWSVPWGGGTAMRKETFHLLQVKDVWEGSLSDDLQLGNIASQRGARIQLQRDLLIFSAVKMTVGSFLEFGVRQYRHVWMNTPRLWFMAFALLAIQTSGWVFLLSKALLVGPGEYAEYWAIAYGASFVRGFVRYRLVRIVLGQPRCLRMRLPILLDALFPFFVAASHLSLAIGAVFSRSLTWGGYKYWVRKGKVVRMEQVTDTTSS